MYLDLSWDQIASISECVFNLAGMNLIRADFHFTGRILPTMKTFTTKKILHKEIRSCKVLSNEIRSNTLTTLKATYVIKYRQTLSINTHGALCHLFG